MVAPIPGKPKVRPGAFGEIADCRPGGVAVAGSSLRAVAGVAGAGAGSSEALNKFTAKCSDPSTISTTLVATSSVRTRLLMRPANVLSPAIGAAAPAAPAAAGARLSARGARRGPPGGATRGGDEVRFATGQE
jgi:hypothetical protein